MEDLLSSQQGQHVDEAVALVIDDEAMIRQLMHRILEPRVCRVAEAASAEDGLYIIERGVPPIDVVFTDLQMPGLNGWDVIEVLARYRPGLPVVAISGYGETADVRLQRLGARFLSKPFTEAALTNLASTIIADTRAIRARAQAQRDCAELRQKLDLVAAAWELHRRPHPRDEQPLES